MEKAIRIGGGEASNVLERSPAEYRNGFSDMEEVGRFITLASEGLWGEIRAVGLDQDPIGGRLPGNFPEEIRLRIGEWPGEGDIPSHLPGRFRQGEIAGEAVEDPPYLIRPLLAQDPEEIGVGLSIMNDEGKGKFPGQMDLAPEGPFLVLPGREVPVEIETDRKSVV